MAEYSKWVICNHCGMKYDLTEVHVIERYVDCSVFTTPCCNRTADDRKWKSMPDFREVDEPDISDDERWSIFNR